MQVDGLSNLFWGWGREDDELYVRMKEKGMKVPYTNTVTNNDVLCGVPAGALPSGHQDWYGHFQTPTQPRAEA